MVRRSSSALSCIRDRNCRTNATTSASEPEAVTCLHNSRIRSSKVMKQGERKEMSPLYYVRCPTLTHYRKILTALPIEHQERGRKSFTLLLFGSTLCICARNGVVRLRQFFIQKLVQFFDERHEFVVILFSGDFSGQLSQVFSFFNLGFRLHGAFPRPIAERPVFGFCRYVRASRNGVRTWTVANSESSDATALEQSSLMRSSERWEGTP